MKTGAATAKVTGLNDSVKYQKNSVVSKELIRKQAGTITLFSFDKGQGLSEHTAPFDALVYIIDGKARINIGATPFDVKKGEFIILPAGKIHSLKAAAKFKMMLVMIRSND